MNHKEVDVYKLSVRLAVDVYAVTANFPKSELFGLTSQMRRASVSIACNISEGAARNGRREFIYFVGIARGSCAELLTLIEIAEGIAMLDTKVDLTENVTSVAKMLTTLVRSLHSRSEPVD